MLRRHRLDDVALLRAAVAESFAELHPWMPWAVEPPTRAHQEAYVRDAIAAFDAGRSWGYVITVEDEERVVGDCGLRRGRGRGVLEIGYWVHTTWTGRGIATAAAGALTTAALALRGVRRVEIHCDETNTASAAVARTLGYRLAATIERPPRAAGETGREQVWAYEPDAADG